jgi:hypothetical protein
MWVNAFKTSREKIHGASSVEVRHVLAGRYDYVVNGSNAAGMYYLLKK